VFILSRYSRKTVGARASYSKKSDDVAATWNKELLAAGVLDAEDKPLSFSDRGGSEVKAKSTREYFN
jgi:hypothetical protein